MDFGAALSGNESTNLPVKLDISIIKSTISQYSAMVDQMVEGAKKFVIKDELSRENAVAFAGKAKTIFNEIEKQRKSAIEIPQNYIKSVNNFCNTFKDRLECVEKELKEKIKNYNIQVEMERRKKEEEAKKAAEKFQKELDKEAKKKGFEAPIVPIPFFPKEETKIRTETGTTAYERVDWKFRIIDIEKIPREYLIPDEKKIDKVVKMGIREIPGIEIYQETDIRIRT